MIQLSGVPSPPYAELIVKVSWRRPWIGVVSFVSTYINLIPYFPLPFLVSFYYSLKLLSTAASKATRCTSTPVSSIQRVRRSSSLLFIKRPIVSIRLQLGKGLSETTSIFPAPHLQDTSKALPGYPPPQAKKCIIRRVLFFQNEYKGNHYLSKRGKNK